MSKYNPFIIKPKAHLDYLSSEYVSVDYDTRLLNMALFLHQGGNLQTYINMYRNRYEDYVTRTIYDTLMMNLMYLRMGEPITELNLLFSKILSENELIILLSAELLANYREQSGMNDRGTFERNKYMDTYNFKQYSTEDELIYGELLGKVDIFAERLEADNPWLFVAKEIEDTGYKNPTCGVHPKDRMIIEKYNASASDNYRLRLNLPPEPFQGNPLTAEVVILMLNPGFVERYNVDVYNILDETVQKRFIKAKCATMSMQDVLCVSEDVAINIISELYWERKLRYVLKTIPDANKKIAVICLLGYFSTKYEAIPKRFFDDSSYLLHTQEYTMRLVRYLMSQDKVIVIRSKKWYQYIPELKKYPKSVLLKSYLNPTISPNNCENKGWELITTALK